MGPALPAKFGSRGKIQLRCFQGQRASLLSQRHKVAPLISATKPCEITCWRISATERGTNGTPEAMRKRAGECLDQHDETGGKSGPYARHEAAPQGQAIGQVRIAYATS